MSKVYITSDLHLGHANILKFCNRPFTDIFEHDTKLVENWNSVVQPEDTVYILGDVGFGNRNYLRKIISQLNGYKILIKGNHDFKNILKNGLQSCFEEIHDALRIEHNKVICHLSHYPYLCWPGNYRFEPNFHGHVHLKKNYTGSDKFYLENYASPDQYDVGVDLNNYTPMLLDEAIEKVKIQRENKKNCYNMWCI